MPIELTGDLLTNLAKIAVAFGLLAIVAYAIRKGG